MIRDKNDSVALEAHWLSKKFCKRLRRSLMYGFYDLLSGLTGWQRPTDHLRRDEFWAIKNVDLTLYRGEIAGVIGPNGCGKTTLLRLFAGVYPPDHGTISGSGRVSPLITLGAGFHPYMTVSENIFLNGTILGMSKNEIREKFDNIIAFAGIEDFISSPVAALSSGMRVRLGFSIAIAVEPQILLIDEVIAVGDQAFREKCLRKIVDMSQNTAVLFVSHNLEMVEKVCNRVHIMKKGSIVDSGIDVKTMLKMYTHDVIGT